MSHDMKIQRGNGNVFEDIGARCPERVMTRARVMARISDILRDRGLTQKQAAKLLGMPQSKISCLMNGKLSMFSLDTLFGILNALDKDVEIVIHPKRPGEKKAVTQVWLKPSFA